MKKLMFSALACVAFAFNGFASNAEDNDARVPCKWRTVIVVDGIKYYSDWQHGECWKLSASDGTTGLYPIKQEHFLSPR